MRKIYMSFMSLFLIVVLNNTSHAQNNNSSNQPFYLGNSEVVIKQLKDQRNASNLRGTNSRLSLRISPTRTLQAKVNFNQAQAVNAESFIGELENVPASTFYIRINGSSIEGSIVLRNSKEAYKYYSDEKGNAYVKEVNINEIICINFDDLSTASTSKRTEAVAIGPAVANLQSYPGANGCALLDFDGQYVSGTPWNNGNPIDAQPSNLTDAQIQEVWEMVSEDYRPFHLNITTSEAVFNSYPKNRRMRCIITPTNTAAPGSGGVAYISSFNWNDDTPCWVFNSGVKGAGEAASHEIGHTFSLRHDGRTTPAESYYAGQGSWAPIMGVGYGKSVTQWSKGEYTSANNLEDDLAKISGATFGVGYKADDYGSTIAAASSLKYDATGKVSISGVIEKNTDVDIFSFTTGGGTMTLNFSPATRHADLDILATLYNSSGGVVSTSNPTGLSASFSIALAQGTYYISVDGTGSGVPTATGYSDYASLGHYSISGTIPSVTPTTVATFYGNCNYDVAGYAISLDLGNYTSAQLLAKGIANNSISSLKINPGYEVVLYKNDNFSGDTLLIRTDNSCLVNINVNDSTSSLKIRPLSNQLPFVNISSPASGSSFSEPATITISANATDSDGSITKVEFFNGSTKLGEDLTAPYSFVWSNIVQGAYTLTAKATDNIGAVSTSTQVIIQVNSTTAATVYKHCNYNTAGYAVILAPGSYTLAQLNALGILDNDISSLKVRSGYEVILYQSNNFLGSAYVFRADNSCLVTVPVNNTTVNINDWTSSLVVRLTSGTAAYPLAIASNSESQRNEEIAKSIVVAPNPVVDKLSIQFDAASTEAVNVQVFNMHKKEILSVDGIKAGNQIDVSTLSSGLYFVRITLGKHIITQRIVKY